MKKITISEKEYKDLKRRAKHNTELVEKLVRGLEDVKAGRIKPFNPDL